ncbi:hypothetical protein KJ359_006511 [Pestalotiopsis sp. 9143b]|nr:hypothetical protein KJ359_006511 [Pestalotiopsis sp. 9143b]
MDYERCAALHNELLELGWAGSGKSLEYNAADDQALVLHRVSWFDHHGDAAAQVRSLLSPSLVAFLEQALDSPNGHSLSYDVNGLSPPGFLFLNNNLDPDEPNRYVTLYVANLIATHPDGLVFDQRENKAIIQMSMFDSDVTKNGRQQWHPLEVILGNWLDMVQIRKIEAVGDDVEVPNDKFDPWIFRPSSQQQLADTLNVYHELLSAIESRLPEASRPESRSTEPLVSEAMLEAAQMIRRDSFAWSFLSRARRPAFRYIAPGLAIPDAQDFRHQPFSSVETDAEPLEDGELGIQFPILLFPSSELFRSTPVMNTAGGAIDQPFPPPWSEVDSYPAGLYLTDSDREAADFEDGVRLVLSFGIGSRGWARTADGARFGENKSAHGVGRGGSKDTYSDLYQLGYVPFIDSHETRLEQVLQAWLRHIETGLWEVGEDGVLDGINKWREADTEEHWEEYTVPISW